MPPPAAPPRDLSEYDPDRNDRQKIDAGIWVPGSVCESSKDKDAYEAKIVERFGGQQELDLS